jgi:phage head maturation protease
MLDCHSIENENEPLGHLSDVGVSPVDDGLLMGTLVFDNNRGGRRAFAAVERGELTGASCGFEFIDILIHDRDGELDDDTALKRQDDTTLIFCVRRSVLLEVSLCLQPVDPCAIVRACSIDAVAREMVQQGEATLQRLLHPASIRPDQDDDGLREIVMLPRDMIYYGKPERI